MILTRQEENRNRAVSAALTLLIFLLLLLFLILYHIITPNPPFPEGGGGGQELALGMLMGNDNVDFGSMGAAASIVPEKTVEEEKIITEETGEAVPLNEKKRELKKKAVKTPVSEKPKEVVKEKTAAEKLAEKFKKNTGKNGGGIGNNEEAGKSGSPDGKPDMNGQGGSGEGTGGGTGPGEGPGSGPGRGPGFGGDKIGFSLAGRAVVKPPKLPTDTKEEGKVVVDITVDAQGNVIDANPNGRGTTTSSAILKAKARQTALATKFNVSGKFEEQTGTITIIFSFN